MHPFISSPLQTAVAAVVSMGLAQALHLPDPYWAPISAIVCSLDAFEGAAATARRRLVGTLIGVVLAALQVSFTAYNLINYGLAIALLGLLCRATRLHPSSLRFGAIALTVVVSDPNKSMVWLTAGARFVDVALGIAVALLVVKAWPQGSNQDQ
jgi:uncharacterized membrane protein YgaE (UPF0421/DUF939 family)